MVDTGEAVEVGSPAGEEVDEVRQLGGDGDQSREFVADQTRGFGEACGGPQELDSGRRGLRESWPRWFRPLRLTTV